MRDKKSMSAAGVCLSLALLSSSALAETCTASPDCKTLGYTEASCPDGGVKCPFGNYWFCGGKSCKVKTCQVGDVLYADKKCYECFDKYIIPQQTPIAIVFSAGKAINLTDFDKQMGCEAISFCKNYTLENVSGWHLPTYNEFQTLAKNITLIQTGLKNARGGSMILPEGYRSSTIEGYDEDDDPYYYIPKGTTGYSSWWGYCSNGFYVRCVLDF